MPKLECILAFLRSVSILLQYINMVIDQLASATLLKWQRLGKFRASCKKNKQKKCLTVAKGTALMKHLQFIKDGLMSKDDIFIHIINCPYTVLTVWMKSFGRALHLYGLISCMLAVRLNHREQA